MQISFSGTLSPYIYNCPHAHRLRNIDKVKIERAYDTENQEDDNISPMQFGIQQHATLAQYLKDEIESYEYSTPTIEWFKAQSDKKVETTIYAGLDLSPLPGKKENENYIVARPDAVAYNQGGIKLFDWKFGNSDYGSPRYYDEIEFYLVLEAAANPDISYWESIVHFPVQNYTLPIRTYNVYQIARLQQSYQQRIDLILNDKFLTPNPGKIRCRFCDHRSEETGGSGHCNYTVI